MQVVYTESVRYSELLVISRRLAEFFGDGQRDWLRPSQDFIITRSSFIEQLCNDYKTVLLGTEVLCPSHPFENLLLLQS